MSERRRRRFSPWWAVPIVLVLGAIGWAGFNSFESRRAHADIARARAEIDARLFSTARGRLLPLTQGRAGRDEALFELGRCEKALGRNDAALNAWTAIDRSSPWFPRSAADAGAAYLNTGHYRKAEAILLEALTRATERADSHKLHRELSRLYRFEGRIADIRRVLRASWPYSDDRPGLLRELWLLDNSPQPVDAWSGALAKADQGDDRVVLGRAVVATLVGRYEEARRLLSACPDDPPVWRARYELALASDDEAGLWAAAAHLPADGLEPAVRAWLLARGSDREAERKALQALIASDPGNAPALDRLAGLEADAGRRDVAEALHRKKAEIDHAKNRMRTALLGTADLRAIAGELSKFNATLGRRFDAWGWSQVVPGATADSQPPSDLKFSAIEPPTRGENLASKLTASGLSPRKEPTTQVAAAAVVIPLFTDDAAAAGLSFTFENGATPRCQLPETMSGGVAVLDFDGDGWLDIYVVQGGPIETGTASGSRLNGDRLFRNQRDGTFRDVSEAAGIPGFSRDYGLGVAVGDYDNDGRPDIFVTRLRSYALYRNNGDGTFRDVTEAAGLAGTRDNPTSAAWADLDGDGDLDLYVCHYMKWDPNNPRICTDDKGKYFYCDPSKVDSAPDHVFRNDGGRFTDVTKEAGFTDPDGRGLGVVAADLDGDGRTDLYVANDGTANFFFRNLGGFRFEEVGLLAGVAAGPDGGYQASMGIACGDYDGDGLPDLVVTNFYGESSTLYRNLGKGLFQDQTAASNIGTLTRYLLGFGTSFGDVNNDGRLDLVTVNGHVNDNRPFYQYAMPSMLLLGEPGARFIDVSDRAGDVWRVPRVGRGLSVADLDNDGRLDALIIAQNEPLAFFHNRGPATGNLGRAVTFQLEGTKSNRDGVGAVVTVKAGGRNQVAHRFGGGSYQSAGDPRVHFGLGDAREVESVEVRWPSGQVDQYGPLASGTGYLLREGQKSASPLAGFAGH